MINIITTLKGHKKTDLVFLCEKTTDIKKLGFLGLDKKVENKIKDVIGKQENKKLDFFIDTQNFEYLHVFFYSKKGTKTLIEFLGEQFPKVGEKITLFCEDEKNIVPFVDAAILSKYTFDTYKSKKEEKKIHIFIDKKDKKHLESRVSTLKNITLARDLGETPSSDLTPEAFASLVKKTKFKNIKVKILTPKDIQKKGLNLLYSVGKGSVNKPYMVILEKIVDKTKPVYGLVGKGITFDSGGIQVKPDNYMYEMKGDMCGAANTYAIMKELDEKNLNINLVAALCLAENSISGECFKPSDIITAYNGKTVDIIHTDAEGRLVLADGLSYISKKYKTSHIISMATLTGAVMVGLGHRHAGIMGNDSALIKKFTDYSKVNFEKYIELPFDNYLIEKTKGDIADVKNLTEGIHAGSSMGAAFLANFIENDSKYTHIDIAGVAINSYEAYGLMNKGMTGFGVDSISNILQNIK